MRTALPRLLLTGATVVVCLAAASPAHALTISAANVNPATSADANTKNVIYYLDLHAGPQDERFSVVLDPPAFATKGGHDEGRSIDGPRQFTFVGGPGTLGTVNTAPDVGAVCSDRDDAFHGYATGETTVDVALPAGANTTLAVRYGAGRRAPWSDTDLSLRFRIQGRLYGTYDGTSPLFGAATDVSGAQTITATPALPVAPASKGAQIGAHLLLSTAPKGTWGDEDPARRVKRGQRVSVRGSLLPATSGKKVQLQWRKGTGALKVAATVRTGKGGRFTASLAVPGKGTYELWARYPKQSGALRSDTTSCPLRFAAK